LKKRKQVSGTEYNDIYDANRQLTGKVHLRGQRWRPGEYGLTVCVWVYDGQGKILMTRRAKEKSFAGTWENTGGAALAGETSREAILRELREETGIRVCPEALELLDSETAGNTHYDYYCIRWNGTLEQVVLLPGETDAVKWVTFPEVHEMIRRKEICRVIARQFKRQEKDLLARQIAQE